MKHNSKINNKAIASVWVDEIEGAPLNANTADDIAKWIGGSVIANGQAFVSMPTPRGELLVREGDFVGKDQNGKWHLVRLKEVPLNKPQKPSPQKAPKPGPKPSSRP